MENNIKNIISNSDDIPYLQYLFITSCYENNVEIVKHFLENRKECKEFDIYKCCHRCISECLEKYNRTSAIFKMMIQNKKRLFEAPLSEEHLYSAFMLSCYTDASECLFLLLEYTRNHNPEKLLSILEYKNNILFKICMISNSSKCLEIINTFNQSPKNFEFDIFMSAFVVKASDTIEYYLNHIYQSNDELDMKILLNACRNGIISVFLRFKHLCSGDIILSCILRAFSLHGNTEIIKDLISIASNIPVQSKFSRTNENTLMLDEQIKIKNYSLDEIIHTIISEYISTKINLYTSHESIKLLIKFCIERHSIQNVMKLILGSIYIGKYSYIENYPYTTGINSKISYFISEIIKEYSCIKDYYNMSCMLEKFVELYSTNSTLNRFLDYNIDIDDSYHLRIHLLSFNLICQCIITKKHLNYIEKIVSNREIELCEKHIKSLSDVGKKFGLYEHLLFEILHY
jgi:hypothetical protein